MQKPNQHGKINVVGGEETISWYFLRLAFLAVPWKSRAAKNLKGTLFKHYYLVQAKNIKSALNKAKQIIGVEESLDGSAKLNGKRILYKKVGVLDLEPLCERLESGVEVFDESEKGIKYSSAKRQALSTKRLAWLISYEKKKGKPELLDVFWGNDFDKL
jgi:hypothetical protein